MILIDSIAFPDPKLKYLIYLHLNPYQIFYDTINQYLIEHLLKDRFLSIHWSQSVQFWVVISAAFFYIMIIWLS